MSTPNIILLGVVLGIALFFNLLKKK